MQVSSTKSAGFTIVELIVSITISTILTGVVLFSLGNYYQRNISSVKNTTQDTDTRSILRSISNELLNSANFVSDLSVGATQPLGSNNATAAWTYKGSDTVRPNNRVLIANVYATDKPRDDATRMVAFTDTGSGCTPATSTPVKNALIYFVALDSRTNLYNLYRRTITNITGGTLCGTIAQKQTCAAQMVATYPSVCQATDAVIMSNVSSFTVDYYTSSNDSVPLATQYTTATATDIMNAKSVRITAVTNRLVDGVDTPNSASIRISRPY